MGSINGRNTPYVSHCVKDDAQFSCAESSVSGTSGFQSGDLEAVCLLQKPRYEMNHIKGEGGEDSRQF
jgi:hypothetical protein